MPPTPSPPPLSTAALCRLLGVEVPHSAPEATIEGISTLEQAGPRHVSFVARRKLAAAAAVSRAGLLVVPRCEKIANMRAIPVPDVWAAVLALLQHFHPEPPRQASVHPSAVVHKDARIGENVAIGACAVVEQDVLVGDGSRIGAQCFLGRGAALGRDVLLHERVTIREGCRLGDRVIVQAGAVIGADGFKYETIGGRLTKMPQVGIVVVEDDVEIGANSTIDRASFSVTRIGARTKIDNLVQIAHNCEIGSDCIVVAQSGVAGSARLGRGVILGGQVGVSDQTVVGDGTRVAGQSAVHGRIPAGQDLIGTPAMDARLYGRVQFLLRRLPGIYSQLRPMLRQLEGDAEDSGAG